MNHGMKWPTGIIIDSIESGSVVDVEPPGYRRAMCLLASWRHNESAKQLWSGTCVGLRGLIESRHWKSCEGLFAANIHSYLKVI